MNIIEFLLLIILLTPRFSYLYAINPPVVHTLTLKRESLIVVSIVLLLEEIRNLGTILDNLNNFRI